MIRIDARMAGRQQLDMIQRKVEQQRQQVRKLRALGEDSSREQAQLDELLYALKHVMRYRELQLKGDIGRF